MANFYQRGFKTTSFLHTGLYCRLNFIRSLSLDDPEAFRIQEKVFSLIFSTLFTQKEKKNRVVHSPFDLPSVLVPQAYHCTDHQDNESSHHSNTNLQDKNKCTVISLIL